MLEIESGWLEHNPLTQAELKAAFDSLPEKQRATLILRVYHDMPHEEIARARQEPLGARHRAANGACTSSSAVSPGASRKPSRYMNDTSPSRSGRGSDTRRPPTSASTSSIRMNSESVTIRSTNTSPSISHPPSSSGSPAR